MKRFFKNYGALTVVFVLLFIASWQLISRFYNQQVTNQQVTYLQQKGAFLLRVSNNQLATLESYRDTYVADSDERITLLDPSGQILMDSTDSSLQGSRANRAEIKAVMSGNQIGQATRWSTTLHKQLLYVALPIKQNNKIIGFIRLAEPADDFLKKSASIKQSILMIYFLFSFMVYFLALRILTKRNRPVETVLPILKKMIKGNADGELFEPTKPNEQEEELLAVVSTLNEQLNQTYLAYESSEKQLATLFNELKIGIFILDSDGQLKSMNVSMQKNLGIAPIEAWNVPFASVITDTHLIQLIYHVSERVPFVNQEIKINATKKILDITLRYFKEDHQVLVIAYDLTKIRQLEKMQRDFVGNVTHELKTPVTSLIGFTETLLDGAKDDPKTLTDFLTIMQKDAYRLEELIQQVIQLSKSADRYDYELKNIPLFPFIQHIIESYHTLAEEKKIQFQIHGNPDYLFFTKQELLQAILKNLIENALYYSRDATTIQILFSQVNQELTIQVKDQGVGIDEEDQKRIFERFYRADKARTRNSGGSGLGLAIVKEYVEALNGTIELQSYPGIGTTFIIHFPLT
jgi:two-component system phosphate regulon sensor histidine kinase PhoR